MKRRYVVSLLAAVLLILSVLILEPERPTPSPTTVVASPTPTASAPVWNLDRVRGYIDGYIGAKQQHHPCAYISHGPSSDYNAGVFSGYVDASAS